MKCSVQGCDRPYECKGFCSLHYVRLRKHGDVNYTTRRTNADGKGRRAHIHLEIVEAVLGKTLPKGACVHHVNGDPSDNTLTNLVVCPSQAYHMMLHARQRALDACGNPNFRKCQFCKTWDHPESLVIGNVTFHKECKRQYQRKRA